MKTVLLCLLILSLSFSSKLQAQGVVINENNPNAVLDNTAVLELQSTAKGFLPPRLTTEQMQNIQNPAAGLVIYNLTIHCLELFNGTTWMSLCDVQQPIFQCGTTISYQGDEYQTIQIGNQCWFAENLKTTKYNDNTNIEYPGTNNAAWIANSNGAYAWHENDLQNKDKYGALYNKYAVVTEKLCPTGWRVSSENDWNELIAYVGTESGRKLKSERTALGNPNVGFPTNEHPRWDWHSAFFGIDQFGFTAFSGGARRFENGLYETTGLNGYFYTSNSSKIYYMTSGGPNVLSFNGNPISGFSVRCVKN
jgi:uncharacterized protein (TIGR02145 family)